MKTPDSIAMASGETAEEIKTIETILGEKPVVWVSGNPGSRFVLVPWEGGGFALHQENEAPVDDDADGFLPWYFILVFGGDEQTAIRAAKKFLKAQPKEPDLRAEIMEEPDPAVRASRLGLELGDMSLAWGAEGSSK